jgi:hypothetical protein
VIKAASIDKDGNPVVLLGLSQANLAHMAEGMPIRLNLSELGLPPTWVLITTGKDEDAILGDLRREGIQLRRLVDHRETGGGG